MLLIQVSWGLAQWALDMTAQRHLGAVGVLLLLVIGAGIRAGHNRLAVGAAIVFALLMTQA